MTLAYATYLVADDVRAELKNINFTNNTNLDAARIDDLIDRTQASVDGDISYRYILPINPATYVQAGLVLKEICTKLTASHVDDILRQNGVVINDGDKAKLKKLESDAEDMLKAIKEDRKLLLNVPRVTAVSATISGSKPRPAISQSVGINSMQNGVSAIGLPTRLDANRREW